MILDSQTVCAAHLTMWSVNGYTQYSLLDSTDQWNSVCQLFSAKNNKREAGERRRKVKRKKMKHMCAGVELSISCLKHSGYIGCICVYWMLIWMCVYMSSFVCINIVWYDWTKNRLLLHIRLVGIHFLEMFQHEILDFFSVLSFGFFFPLLWMILISIWPLSSLSIYLLVIFI